MILTALLALVVLAVVIEWQKRLPRSDERFSELSPARTALTVMIVPVSAVVTAVGGIFLFAAMRSDRDGVGRSLLVGLLALVVGGFAYLLIVGTHRILRLSRKS